MVFLVTKQYRSFEESFKLHLVMKDKSWSIKIFGSKKSLHLAIVLERNSSTAMQF